MKRFILILIFTLLIPKYSVFGQQNNEGSATPDFYLQQSKRQKSTGWILLGVGTAMMVGGAATFESSWGSNDYGTTDFGGVVLLTGIVVDAVSIPFFISSGRNKRRATLGLNYQNVQPKISPIPSQKGIVTLSMTLDL